MSRLHAIIPAGGAGTRLWPLSRRERPKFLHDLTGSGRSLLQATVDRLCALTDSITVVTGDVHAEAVRRQLPHLDPAALLTEPSPRDSMAAIGLAAAVLVRQHPADDVVVGSFAADHVITDDVAFTRSVRAAVAAAEAGYVATIGIEATTPSTAFGYIETGPQLPDVAAALPVHRVAAFTEKPDADTAAAYLSSRRYRWNAGMFVVRARVLLDHLAREQPDLAAGLDRIAAAWHTPQRAQVLDRYWPTLPVISIDHAIAEPVAAAGGVAVIPASFGWDDVGDWAALRAVLPEPDDDGGKVRVLGSASAVLSRDADGSVVVPSGGRTVALLGIRNAVVVDTPDALLVTTTDHAQHVKDIVSMLQGRGADHLL